MCVCMWFGGTENAVSFQHLCLKIWRIENSCSSFQCEMESFDDSVIKHMLPFTSGKETSQRETE